MTLFIGMMSGTSVDAIDAAVVDFSGTHPKLIAAHQQNHTPELRQQLLALGQPGENEINRMMAADHQLGHALADAALAVLKKANIAATSVTAIGSHGQTIRHLPHLASTLQIGDPNIIAERTGIATVSDFRRRDMAQGGQGAPFAPLFHQQVFSSDVEDRAVINIGGIANISILPKSSSQKIIGFDTGPGNCLMDEWVKDHLQIDYDKDGVWAASGCAHPLFLAELLKDSYFTLPPPKSSGREYFNRQWLHQKMTAFSLDLKPEDVQATLLELTAHSIHQSILQYAPTIKAAFICGGGALNLYLMRRLRELGAIRYQVFSTEQLGIHPCWAEAMLFAWLAKQRVEEIPCQLQTITGTQGSGAILGGLYLSAMKL